MAERKTMRNDGDVDAFLDSGENPTRRQDARAVRDMMASITGSNAEM